MFLSGLSTCFVIVESTYFSDNGYTSSFRSWPRLWLFSCILSCIAGPISYFFRGMIYYLGVKLAGGKTTYKQCRRIVLFCGVPLYITIIFIELINTIIYWNSYFIHGGDIYLINIVWLFLKISSWVLLLILLYQTALLHFNMIPFKSMIFFILIPIIYNLFLLLSNEKYLREIMKIYKEFPHWF